MPRIVPAFALLLMLAVGTPSLAQMGGTRRGGMDGGGMGRSRSGGDDLSGVTRMSANDQLRMHITDTRLALKLEPAQNAVWQAYEDRVIALLSDLSRGAGAPSEGDAVKQIDARVDVARNRLAAMEELSDTAKKLYAILSAEQKQVADRMLAGTVPALYAQPSAFRADGGTRDRQH
jgi:LTXXQ motif family protein